MVSRLAEGWNGVQFVKEPDSFAILKNVAFGAVTWTHTCWVDANVISSPVAQSMIWTVVGMNAVGAEQSGIRHVTVDVETGQ